MKKSTYWLQAIWRQAVKKGVAKKRKNKEKNPVGHAYIKKFIALAFLPADQIKVHFQILKKEVMSIDPKKWKRFVDYYEKTWLNGFTPEIYSCYGHVVRTNNSIEAYHRVLNSYLRSSLTASAFIRKFHEQNIWKTH